MTYKSILAKFGSGLLFRAACINRTDATVLITKLQLGQHSTVKGKEDTHVLSLVQVCRQQGCSPRDRSLDLTSTRDRISLVLVSVLEGCFRIF